MIRLPGNLHIAYKEWGRGGSRRVLALHGWLDNCNSFATLGPYLAQHDYHVVAFDHIGHGKSAHLPIGAFYDKALYVQHTKAVLDHLQWSSANIVAHSTFLTSSNT